MTTPPVTLEEFKEHLNLRPPAQSNDVELLLELESATDLCEGRIGPILQGSITERVTAAAGVFTVAKRPVVSVETVTGLGTAPDYLPADLDVGRWGLVSLLTGCIASGRYDVAYTAGWAADIPTVPAALKLAVLVTGSHLHETQRGRQGRPDLFGADEFTNAGAEQVELIARGFALPRRAIELMQDFERTGGFA